MRSSPCRCGINRTFAGTRTRITNGHGLSRVTDQHCKLSARWKRIEGFPDDLVELESRGNFLRRVDARGSLRSRNSFDLLLATHASHSRRITANPSTRFDCTMVSATSAAPTTPWYQYHRAPACDSMQRHPCSFQTQETLYERIIQQSAGTGEAGFTFPIGASTA